MPASHDWCGPSWPVKLGYLPKCSRLRRIPRYEQWTSLQRAIGLLNRCFAPSHCHDGLKIETFISNFFSLSYDTVTIFSATSPTFLLPNYWIYIAMHLQSLLTFFLLSFSPVAWAGSSCVAFDVTWNLLAFGFNGKDYNAGTQDTWTSGKFLVDRLQHPVKPFDLAGGTPTDITTSGRPWETFNKGNYRVLTFLSGHSMERMQLASYQRYTHFF